MPRAAPASRWSAALAAAFLVGLLAACGRPHDLEPINQPVAGPLAQSSEVPYTDAEVETAISLSFSGGGMRAAAFSYGVLDEMARIQIRPTGRPVPLLESIDLVSGVSGGAVTAAWFGLKGRAGLRELPERFLFRNAEESIDVDLGIANLLSAFQTGGVNDRSGLSGWLDRNLFDGATFKELRGRRPLTLIAAADLHRRTPFVFESETFAAMCSDLSKVSLADAVATSSAVPIVFAPVNVALAGNTCGYKLPAWARQALADRTASANLRAAASSLKHMSEVTSRQYLKLVDGGLTDNFGIQALSVARYGARHAYAPLTPQAAVRLSRGLFLVVNSGRAVTGPWHQSPAMPSGLDIIVAASDVSIDATSRNGLDFFALVIRDWEAGLVRWRCALPPEEIRRLRGNAEGWDCRNLKFFVGQVSFEDTSPAMASRLNDIPTRYRLPADDVHLVIDGGRTALRNNKVFKRFLASMPASRPPSAAPAPSPAPPPSILPNEEISRPRPDGKVMTATAGEPPGTAP